MEHISQVLRKSKFIKRNPRATARLRHLAASFNPGTKPAPQASVQNPVENGKGVIRMKKDETLMVIAVDQFDMSDKSTGQKIKKYKYSFLDQNNNFVKGFSDKEIFRLTDAVSGEGKFDPKKAVVVKFVGRIWDDLVKWKLDPDQ